MVILSGRFSRTPKLSKCANLSPKIPVGDEKNMLLQKTRPLNSFSESLSGEN